MPDLDVTALTEQAWLTVYEVMEAALVTDRDAIAEKYRGRVLEGHAAIADAATAKAVRATLRAVAAWLRAEGKAVRKEATRG